MEKDFKKEYQEHLKSETPDLWARIEDALTEKTPASKAVSTHETAKDKKMEETGKSIKTFRTRRWKKWMAAVPAAAAVFLLVVAAPIFMPKGSFESSEKAAMDMAFFDGMADNAAPEAELYAEEEAVMEESIPEYMLESAETDTGALAGSSENGNLSSTMATGSGNPSAESKTESANTDTYADRQETKTTTEDKEQATQEHDDLKKEKTETKVLHLQVVEQIPTDNTNLLAEDKEHINQIYDLYLVLVDGEEKLLAVPIENEMEFEQQIWYDVTVTESEESGIDYIWVEE
ncbi:MAG: hypothetical protein IJW63_08130 [Lachnospiraceae bacterium]|nr:hypothetical protein [Lachnospiraceae bacterium]